MKRLLTLTDENVFQRGKKLSIDKWRQRQAVRAVVIGDSGEIYLLHMSTYSYHKLPGGGVKEGESLELALQRELLEEIGCLAEVVGELGEVVEYRDDWGLRQHSYCYVTKQSGAFADTALEADEIEAGARTVVAINIDEAVGLLENDTPTDYDGHFIKLRDLCFLKEARTLISDLQRP